MTIFIVYRNDHDVRFEFRNHQESDDEISRKFLLGYISHVSLALQPPVALDCKWHTHQHTNRHTHTHSRSEIVTNDKNRSPGWIFQANRLTTYRTTRASLTPIIKKCIKTVAFHTNSLFDKNNV
ncbi:hypothetical protein HanRHA438_Chr13g0593821 [Helianthus annuus]|nr:hypothetical protein HanRHA438_Chr13g0593821 [Helianthus annuus]